MAGEGSWSWGNMWSSMKGEVGKSDLFTKPISSSGGAIGEIGSGIAGIMMSGAIEQNAANMASAYRWQGQMAAAEQQRIGEAAVKNIGRVQEEGLDAAMIRYNALGREVSQQRVAAAGSGIDLSSRTVGKVEETSRKNASWDVAHISEQAKTAADNYNDLAEAAFRNSAYAKISGEYQAQVAKIQGDLQSKISTMSGLVGIIGGSVKLAAAIGLGGYSAAGGGAGAGGFGA